MVPDGSCRIGGTHLMYRFFHTTFVAVFVLFLCAGGLSKPVTVEQKRCARSVYFVAILPDGKTIITGSVDGTVQFWDAESGKELKASEWHPNAVFSVAFSPDRKNVTMSSNDDTVRIWDLSAIEEKM